LVTCHCFLHLRSTFRTELRRAFGLMTARAASQLRRLRRRAAFGTELRFADIRAAVRTERPRRSKIICLRFRLGADVSLRAHVQLRSVIGLLGALIDLLARRFRLRVGVRGCEFLLKVWRAAFTLPSVRVPTNFWADPTPTTRALMKMLLALRNRCRQSIIMRLAADRALQLISRVAGRTRPAAEQIARRPQKRSGRAQRRSLKARHKAVAALVAIELELKPSVGGQVFIILHKLYERHRTNLLKAVTSDELKPPSRAILTFTGRRLSRPFYTPADSAAR